MNLTFYCKKRASDITLISSPGLNPETRRLQPHELFWVLRIGSQRIPAWGGTHQMHIPTKTQALPFTPSPQTSHQMLVLVPPPWLSGLSSLIPTDMASAKSPFLSHQDDYHESPFLFLLSILLASEGGIVI